MAGLTWYVGRAKAMSPREMMWRAGRFTANAAHRAGGGERADAKLLTGPTRNWEALLQSFRVDSTRPVLLDVDTARRIAAGNPSEVRDLVAHADRLLAGERTYFGYPSVDVGQSIDWNHDVLADHHWPAVPSARIDHRVAQSDPKWIWELNRLQHLPVLAQAWLFTGESAYAEAAFDHLDTWLEQNPFGTGIAWRGAFEAAIRAISTAIAVQGLRNSPALTPQRYRLAVRMLDASARYCWRGRSRFSSANNHLVGELAGLATVHLIFPELAAPAALFDECLQTLAVEAERQILADGAGAEQSVSYQMFTAELLSVVAVLLRLRRDDVPPQITAAIERSSRYLSSLVGADDPDPRYGDDDDGFALRLGPEPKRTVRQHLGITAAATGVATRATENTLTAAWYAACLERRLGQRVTGSGQPVTAGVYAPDGGLVVLRSGRRRITMDVGPLGYLSIAAHGHADALSVTLSFEGQDLIVDPGTASYYGKPAWRSVHRGTRVHPTVCVDGVDQSEIGGAFLWSRHARTTVNSVELDRGIVDAEHHGYVRLPDPVVHRRWLVATPGDATVAVVDLIDGRSDHDIVVSWPLAPGLDAEAVDDGFSVSRDGAALLQICCAATAPVEFEQVIGNQDSHLGWWSDRLESRSPAWLLGARCRAAAPVAVLTLLRTVDARAITDPVIGMDAVRASATWSEHGVQRGLTIDRVLSRAIVNGPFSREREVVSNP